MFRKIATETAEAVMKMATNKDEWIKYKTTVSSLNFFLFKL